MVFAVVQEGNDSLFSANGTTWSNCALDFSAGSEVIWASYPMNKFISTSINARVRISTNGSTWNDQALSTGSWGPVYSPELNIACIFTGATKSFYSSNAVTWQTTYGPSQMSGGSYYPSCWSADLGIFVVIAGANILHSTDGINWTYEGTMPGGRWARAIWISDLGLFVASADVFAGTYGIATSTNGITWTARNANTDRTFGLDYSPSLGIIVCTIYGNTTTSAIITSTNSTTWTTRTVPTACNLTGVAWSEKLGLFVASPRGATELVKSTDGISWATASAPTAGVYNGIAWGENKK